uniref:superoxide dismutase n=1 Tax=Erpetoichthys calabaricus TaxID=27687 RepID=A0A8C4X8G4_ERPCA
MAVPAGDIAAARGVWSKIFASPEDNGAAVLARMFSDHPETKSYFSHFGGLDEGSAQVRAHGKTVLTALNDMIQHLDSADGFNGVVAPLAKKHATQLKVDPKNFRLLSPSTIIEEVSEELYPFPYPSHMCVPPLHFPKSYVID